MPGMVKWSLNTTRSAVLASLLWVAITQVDTGHFSFRNTPRPGLIPQEEAPFQNKIFLRGVSLSSWFSAMNPSGGTNINWSTRRSSSFSSGNISARLSPVSGSSSQFLGLTWPSFIYHGLSCTGGISVLRGIWGESSSFRNWKFWFSSIFLFSSIFSSDKVLNPISYCLKENPTWNSINLG